MPRSVMTESALAARRAHHFCGDLLHDPISRSRSARSFFSRTFSCWRLRSAFDVGGFELAVSLAPQVQRLLADAVLWRNTSATGALSASREDL